MKTHRRISAALLTASMALSLLTPAWAAESKSTLTGNVQATVRIDYAQELAELRERGIKAELLQGSTSLGELSLTEPSTQTLGKYPAQVSLRDRLGGDLVGSALPGALDLSIDGLPQGDYTLQFTGKGYVTCKADFQIGTYSRYVEVGTADGTFTLGDVDQNGQLDAKDREAVTKALGSTQAEDLARYDLNGDGRIDIVDLAYVNHNINTPAAQPMLLETSCLDVRVDVDQMALRLSAAGTAVHGGSLSTLLQENDQATTFTSSSNEVVIPVPLSNPADVENLQIVTPDSGSGAIQAGHVAVEYEDGGSPEVHLFDSTKPEGVHAISRTPGSNVITIPLGRKVAVKKITITVTKMADNRYATIETIRFLKDIAPEDLSEPNNQVKGLAASAGDAQVSLSWNPLPNVSGYRVEYWLKDQESTHRQLNVDVPKAQVTGLDNLKAYQFSVTPVDGSWQGKACQPVEATPQPAKAPSAPDMVNIVPGENTLNVSWKASKNATWYEVYYTSTADTPTSSYLRAGDRVSDTHTQINSLTNGTTYYIYVTAGNEAGRSGPSRIYCGTPKAVDYSRPEGIPTQGILDNSKIESITLADSGNYHAPDYTANSPFTTQNMIDGDFCTHWTASTNATRNEHVNITFKEPVNLTAAFWVPRLDGKYPSNLRAYSVRVQYDGEADGQWHLLTGGIDNGGGSNAEVWSWPEIPNRSTIPTDRFALLPFGPAENVKRISIAVEQAAYEQVSLSELMFMEYDPEHNLPGDIAALFNNDLYTQLAPGVMQSQIDALKARLESDERNYYLNTATLDDELVLAQELLDGKESSGVMVEGIQSRSTSADQAKYGQSGSGLQPLGVAAKAGQKITVYASGIPEGETVSIRATQFNAEASTWEASAGTLVNGRNILTIPQIGSQNTERGGSLYVTYSGSSQNITLHIRQAVDIPMLELSDWYALDDTRIKARIGAYVDELTVYTAAQKITDANKLDSALNVTEISMPSVLLSLPALAVLNANGLDRDSKIENLYQNVLAWEDLMHICNTTQGIDKTYGNSDMTSRQNIRCMQMFTGAFMYAAGSHIGIGYESCGGVVSGKPIAALPAGAGANQLFGWGIAHEIGHNMDKLGRAEITNNLYSLMVQTFDGKQNTLPSRLEKSGKYPEIFIKTAQGWPGESNNVFVQLGMYWQLHLAYDDGDSPMDFYNRFFKAWKSGTYTQGMSGLSYDEKVALTASGTANKNLTSFFEHWGMTLSDEVKTQLKTTYSAEEDRAIWYLSDQSRRDRLNGTQPAAGTVTASAALKEETDNTIQVSIQSSLTAGKLQGFEILRNETPIGFIIPGADGTAVYEDVIGSGNHRTYNYQVKSYDILGNLMRGTTEDGITEAGEIRVAYDQTVDPGKYTIARNGTTVTITFQEATSISGLKVNNPPASGAYTVTVDASFTGENSQTVSRQVVARTGSFDQGNQAVDSQSSYLTYFQKPGVQADDTRIWTYDAKTVTITGIPSTVPNGDIQLVSYAGDDVAFLEQGAVGRLSADYLYDPQTGEIIPKDTLVVIGTYRGDPRFCIPKIKGRFTVTTADENTEPSYEDRYLNGDVYLLAEIPEDQQVSDISDGIFIFVPNVQQEAVLQEKDPSHCDGVNLLPSQMKAVLARTDQAGSADSQRVTAETLWIGTPGGTDLPVINFTMEGGNE
ncbi:MAG: hypothetical protein HFF52_07390 [Lawsonibacter sp.]|nr:hypothetical protein [Lawsonibacter sp.]